ncbi:16S rRNA (cytosine(1402)-N(4))-methyltransferase RsmH [Candidatus Latescibacterota bacterium]
MRESFHIPVLRDKVLDYLQIQEGGFFVDCTLGDGGHAEGILRRGGTVWGIDRDETAVSYALNRLNPFGERFRAVRAKFSCIVSIVGVHAGAVDGVLMDVGVSSRMIDDPTRGFSYLLDGPLLMDMGLSETRAEEIINTWDAPKLAKVFRDYGEERHARRIAGAIVQRRSSSPIATTAELADIVERTVGGKFPQKSKARIFQALRIAVNDELDELRWGLEGARDVLRPGGRLCVISYHSLEDRTVKKFMRREEKPCVCPPDLPECRCGREATLRVVTRRPVRPDDCEVTLNPRSRSARLRVAEKLKGTGHA